MPHSKSNKAKRPDMEHIQFNRRFAVNLLETGEASPPGRAEESLPVQLTEQDIVGFTLSYDRPLNRIRQETLVPSLIYLRKPGVDCPQLVIVLHTLGVVFNEHYRRKTPWAEALKTAGEMRLGLIKQIKEECGRKTVHLSPEQLRIVDSLDVCLKPDSQVSCTEKGLVHSEQYLETLRHIETLLQTPQVGGVFDQIVERYKIDLSERYPDMAPFDIDDSARVYLKSELAFHVLLYREYGINNLVYAGRINELVDIAQTFLPHLPLKIGEIIIPYIEVETVPSKRPKQEAQGEERAASSRSVSVQQGHVTQSFECITETAKSVIQVRTLVYSFVEQDAESAVIIVDKINRRLTSLQKELEKAQEVQDTNSTVRILTSLTNITALSTGRSGEASLLWSDTQQALPSTIHQSAALFVKIMGSLALQAISILQLNDVQAMSAFFVKIRKAMSDLAKELEELDDISARRIMLSAARAAPKTNTVQGKVVVQSVSPLLPLVKEPRAPVQVVQGKVPDAVIAPS